MKRHSISRAALAIGIGLALTSSAQAIVIDNGIPEGTVGHFSADVQSGGAVSRVLFTTRRFDSPEIVNASLVSQYQVFVDPGHDGDGFVLSGSAPTLFEAGTVGNSVRSSGSFVGANGPISWTANSEIPQGEKRLVTSYTFFSDPNPLGALGVLQYLDGDMSDGSDVLRIRNQGRMLQTLGNNNLFGVAMEGQGVFTGGAADVFNLIVPRIVGDGQSTSPNITIANLVPFEHPELGSMHGPGDVVSVLAFNPSDLFSRVVFVGTTLSAVAPPRDPSPPRDSDGDGVPNPSDHCPGTPAGTPVQSTLQLHKLPRGSSGKGVEDRVAASL